MTEDGAESFFEDLPSFARFSGVVDEANFHDLPESWHLATADIVRSTNAIEAGRYKAVNMAGRQRHIGGDQRAGASRHPVRVRRRRRAPGGASLGGRKDASGVVGRSDLGQRGTGSHLARRPHPDARAHRRRLRVRVARFQAAHDVTYAMFAGGGVSWAEAEMKAGRYAVPTAAPGLATRPHRPVLPLEPDRGRQRRDRLDHRRSRDRAPAPISRSS